MRTAFFSLKKSVVLSKFGSVCHLKGFFLALPYKYETGALFIEQIDIELEEAGIRTDELVGDRDGGDGGGGMSFSTIVS